MSELLTPKAWAQVYANPDFIEVQTYSGYRNFLPDPEGKVYHFPASASDVNLGEAILASLAASRFLPPQANAEFFDIRGRVVPLYEAWVKKTMAQYGYASKRAMFVVMKSCSVERIGGTITVRPSRHEKLEAWSGDGLKEEDQVHVPAESDSATIGRALRLALSRCT